MGKFVENFQYVNSETVQSESLYKKKTEFPSFFAYYNPKLKGIINFKNNSIEFC